jgi:cytochrome P450
LGSFLLFLVFYVKQPNGWPYRRGASLGSVGEDEARCGGLHHGLGAMLALAEIRAVFEELLARAGDIGLGNPV